MKLASELTPIQKISLTLTAIAAIPALASGWWWRSSNNSFVVDVTKSGPVVAHAGESAHLTGAINWAYSHSRSWGHAPNGILDQTETHFYFPDLAQIHEVTSQVNLDKRRLTFSFDSPALDTGSSPSFIVIIGRVSPRIAQLQAISAKLQKRIAAIQSILNQYQRANSHWKKEETEELDSLIACLRRVNQKLADALAQKSEILAKREFPIQVDNADSALSRNRTLVGGMSLDLGFDHGVVFQGESTTGHALLSNMRDRIVPDSGSPFEVSCKKGDQWTIEYYWNGTLLSRKNQTFDPGATIGFDFDTGKADPSKPNLFQVYVYKTDKNDDDWGHDRDRDSDHHHDYGSDHSKILFGSLSLVLQVARDTVPPVWLAGNSPHSPYVKTLEPISATLTDPLGQIDLGGFQAQLLGTKDSGGSVSQDLSGSLSIQSLDGGATGIVSGLLPTLSEGLYSLTLLGRDFAGNPSTALVSQFRLDQTAPTISLITQDHIITRNSNFSVSGTVNDRSPVSLTLTQNGVPVATVSDNAFNLPVLLSEGPNFFSLTATDAAGNTSQVTTLSDIVLDTTPPLLSNVTPIDGATLNNLNVAFSAQSNEPLQGALVNGVAATLSSDKKNISAVVAFVSEGQNQINAIGTDLAGNITQLTISVKVQLGILNASLISIIPTTDGTLLQLIGAQGACAAGATINAKASLFNSASTTCSSQQTFQLLLAPFSSVAVTANLGAQTNTATLSFGGASGTTLSGSVRNTSDQPIPGVTVTVVGSNPIQTSITGANGVFTFSKVFYGDQNLLVDGTTALPAFTGPNISYSKTLVSVPVALGQPNALSRPIYLIPTDSTNATTVVAGQPTIVTNPNAPGVQITIPADSITFPDGTKTGVVSMTTISKDFATVPPLSVAVPNQVIALEPSGVIFSQPVELKIPNVNDLPPGVELFILSMDSKVGKWSIDGIGQVSSDRASVVTKSGQGLTHFSLVYGAPAFPVVRQFGSQDAPGANTFDGSSSTQVVLPNFKVFGETVTPSIAYKSSWASPTAMIQNTFSIPRRESNFTQSSYFRRDLTLEDVCGPDLSATCSDSWDRTYNLITFSVHDDIKAWYEPNLITGQFRSGDITTQPFSFAPTSSDPLPVNSLVAYSMDLVNPNTGEFEPSGITPFLASYEIQLKQMVMRTRTTMVAIGSSRYSNPIPPVFNTQSLSEENVIDRLFPQDLSGSFNIQNYSNSAAGRGWRIQGAQKLILQQGSRILLEEQDGSTSTYAINNGIETLYDGSSETQADLTTAVDLSTWPIAAATGKNVSGTVDLSSAQTIFQKSITLTPSSGSYTNVQGLNCTTVCTNICRTTCPQFTCSATPFTDDLNAVSVLRLQDGSQIRSAKTGRLDRISGGSASTLTQSRLDLVSTYGFTQRISNVPGNAVSPLDPATFQQFCQDGTIDCGTVNTSCGISSSLTGIPSSQGTAPFNPSPASALAALNTNEVLVAEPNFYRISKVNLTDLTVTTIAGNGSPFENGDGMSATSTSISRPLALAVDSVGNIYFTTDTGKVRKIDPAGIVTSIAGYGSTKVLSDGSPADQVTLINPSGLALDEVAGRLYVSDTGNNRIVAIDLVQKFAFTIVGTGVRGFAGDGGSAALASLNTPKTLGLDNQGNLLIHDSGNKRIRRVDFSNSTGGTQVYLASTQDNSKLRKNSDGTWTRTMRNGATFSFDSNGLLTLSSDRRGRQVSYSYDSQSRMKKITIAAPTPREINYTYSGSLLDAITDPAGRITRFNYLGNLLQSVILPDGTTRSFKYDSNGLLISDIDQRRNEIKYGYNNYKRLNKITRPDGKEIIVNDAGSQVAANENVNGATAPLKTDGFSAGQVSDSISTPAADGTFLTTSFIKSLNGYVAQMKDENGKITVLTRDDFGRILEVDRPDGSSVKSTYNSYGDLISTKDTLTNLEKKQDFDAFGNKTSDTNLRGFTTNYTYAPDTGLVTQVTDALNQVTKFSYIPFGLVSIATDPRQKQFLTNYDDGGNLKESIDPLGHKTSTLRDFSGNVLTVTDPNLRTVTYTHDFFNRIKTVKDATQNLTTYDYYESGELKQVTDALGNTIQYDRDVFGRVTTKTDQLGFITRNSYDDAGNLSQVIDPKGNIFGFKYDSKGRLTKKILPEGDVNIAFDDSGNIQSVSDSDSQVVFGYNSLGQLNSAQTYGVGGFSDAPNVTLTFIRDGNGNRNSMTTPVGTFGYLFDELDRMYQITDPTNRAFHFSFDVAGRPTTLQRPGSSAGFTFDDANRLSSIENKVQSQTLNKISLVRSETGDILSATSDYGSAVTSLFSYDDNRQLKSATNPEAVAANQPNYAAEDFSYDPIYNRKTETESGQLTTNSFDAKSQRITRDFRNYFFYDNNGNLISKQAIGMTGQFTQYQYSSENQLIKILEYTSGPSDPSQIFVVGNSVLVRQTDYRYDGLGRRIEKRVQNFTAPNDVKQTYTRRYLYDGQDILVEYDGQNRVLASYVHSTLAADDVLAANVTSTGATEKLASSAGYYVYLKNTNGTVTDVLSDTGLRLQHYIYSAFGERIAVQNGVGTDISSNPVLNTSWGFGGREHDDESTFIYQRARYYSPEIGRFIQADPSPGKLASPMSVVNSYAFANNNPINNLDPTGLSVGSVLAAIGIIIAGVVLTVVTLGAVWAGAAAAAATVAFDLSLSGIAGAVVGGAVGAVTGAAIGAAGGWLAGGLIGGGISIINGGSFGEGFTSGSHIGIIAGAGIGAALGAVSGALAGYNPLNALLRPMGTYAQMGVVNTSEISIGGTSQALRFAGCVGISVAGAAVATYPLWSVAAVAAASPDPFSKVIVGLVAVGAGTYILSKGVACFGTL